MTLLIYLNHWNTNFKNCWIVSSSNAWDQMCTHSSQLGNLLKIILALKYTFKLIKWQREASAMSPASSIQATSLPLLFFQIIFFGHLEPSPGCFSQLGPDELTEFGVRTGRKGSWALLRYMFYPNQSPKSDEFCLNSMLLSTIHIPPSLHLKQRVNSKTNHQSRYSYQTARQESASLPYHVYRSYGPLLGQSSVWKMQIPSLKKIIIHLQVCA